MAIQKITSSQVAAPSGATSGWVLTSTGAGLTPTFQALPVAGTGARQETQHLSVNTGAAAKTIPTFSFVVGLVFIEILDTDSADANDVLVSGFVNMRSFGGTKTANVTSRSALLIGEGDKACIKMLVNRTTSGTVLVLSQPQGIIGGINPDSSSGVISFTNYPWPVNGRLRITATEDTQS